MPATSHQPEADVPLFKGDKRRALRGARGITRSQRGEHRQETRDTQQPDSGLCSVLSRLRTAHNEKPQGSRSPLGVFSAFPQVLRPSGPLPRKRGVMRIETRTWPFEPHRPKPMRWSRSPEHPEVPSSEPVLLTLINRSRCGEAEAPNTRKCSRLDPICRQTGCRV